MTLPNDYEAVLALPIMLLNCSASALPEIQPIDYFGSPEAIYAVKVELYGQANGRGYALQQRLDSIQPPAC